MSEAVLLQRDCDAILIPSGEKITLFKGTQLTITQALGGAYTVVTHQGTMASVAGKDADALGKKIPTEAQLPEGGTDQESVQQAVWQVLRTCYDPEIPHNIVDLGLIYECTVTPREDNNGFNVYIKMTLTAPGGSDSARAIRRRMRSL